MITTKEKIMNKVKVYVKDYCPYCQRVMNYLDSNKVSFEKIELSDKPDVYEALKKETGHHTVPQVFIDGKFIGGSDDFNKYVALNQI
jgi:glutaredoxin 3